MARDKHRFMCECSVCGMLGPGSLFQKWVFDGGEKICTKCHKDIHAERMERIAWAYSVYWIEPEWGDRWQMKERYHKRKKVDRERHKQYGERKRLRLLQVEE